MESNTYHYTTIFDRTHRDGFHKKSGNRLLAYIDVLFILNESLKEILDIKLNELNIINTCL